MEIEVGHQSLVYGVIESRSNPREEAVAAMEANRRAIGRLPERDTWPFLVSGMFSISQSSSVSTEYATTVIHFGASYKELEEEWAEWLAKFEALLSQIQGVAAVVHLESERFGNHKLEWVGKPLKESEDQRITWEFLGGPRTHEALLRGDA